MKYILTGVINPKKKRSKNGHGHFVKVSVILNTNRQCFRISMSCFLTFNLIKIRLLMMHTTKALENNFFSTVIPHWLPPLWKKLAASNWWRAFHNIYVWSFWHLFNTFWRMANISPATIYLFKINNRNTRKKREIWSKLTIRNTRKRREIWSKLTIKTAERRRLSFVDFVQVNVSWVPVLLRMTCNCSDFFVISTY